MKVAATIRDSYQTSPDDWQNTTKTYVFESSQSIDEMLQITGQTSVCALNLSDVAEPRPTGRGE